MFDSLSPMTSPRRWVSRTHPSWAWLATFALLVTNVPLFLCMPIIDDAALWNLHARIVAEGGVPYRDVLETNPPGALWLTGGIRWLLGDTSVAFRTADLAIFGVAVALLTLILNDVGASVATRVWAGALVLLFYFSMSEWCHCQRDMWLMVPSLGWLWLRGRQVQRMSKASSSAGEVFSWSVVEGLVLGAGIWIKPMVLVPAAMAWLLGACQVRNWRSSLGDASGLVLGGLLMGAGGAFWLWKSGAWPYFWETFLEWNPRYVAAGREHWTLVRFLGMCVRLFPWLLLHLAALVVGLAVWRRWQHSPPLAGLPRSAAQITALAGAFYVGWLGQAVLLQHLFDYVHAPGVLLAVLVCVCLATLRPRPNPATRVALAVFMALALVCSPALRWERLEWWPACLAQGSSPDVRDRLRLMEFPEWRELERVAAFLRARGVRDGDVCCFANSTIHLYEMLGIRPPTRHVYLENMLVFFPERRELLRAELEAAAPRYTVTDWAAAGVPPDIMARGDADSVLPGSAASRARVFPWEFPIVFRAGRYSVHRTQGPIASLESRP